MNKNPWKGSRLVSPSPMQAAWSTIARFMTGSTVGRVELTEAIRMVRKACNEAAKEQRKIIAQNRRENGAE